VTTLTLPDPVRLDLGPDDVNHLYCIECTKPSGPATASCGYECPDIERVDGEAERDCPLCFALVDVPCPRCGAP
jgi:hypothetical protein